MITWYPVIPDKTNYTVTGNSYKDSVNIRYLLYAGLENPVQSSQCWDWEC